MIFCSTIGFVLFVVEADLIDIDAHGSNTSLASEKAGDSSTLREYAATEAIAVVLRRRVLQPRR